MKRRSSPVPPWAATLVSWVAATEGRRAPYVTWYNGSGRWSSGHCSTDNRRLHITAGRAVVDQQLVVLHELAHWVREHGRHKRRRRRWHDRRFWETAFELYERFGIPLEYARAREGTYRKTAAAVGGGP